MSTQNNVSAVKLESVSTRNSATVVHLLHIFFEVWWFCTQTQSQSKFFSHAFQTSHSLIQILQLSSSNMGVSVLHFTQSLKVSVSVWFIWFYANLYTTQLIDSKELLLVEMPEQNSISSIMTLHLLLHASSSSFISSHWTPSAGCCEKYMQISDNNVNIVDKDH